MIRTVSRSVTIGRSNRISPSGPTSAARLAPPAMTSSRDGRDAASPGACSNVSPRTARLPDHESSISGNESSRAATQLVPGSASTTDWGRPTGASNDRDVARARMRPGSGRSSRSTSGPVPGNASPEMRYPADVPISNCRSSPSSAISPPAKADPQRHHAP